MRTVASGCARHAKSRAIPTIGRPFVRHHDVVPRSVLIVDDSAPFRLTARALLEARGYAIAGTAADGAGALDAFAELRPDAVLLDVNLPDMDGMAVSRALTAGLNGAAPAVVLVSTVDRAALDGAVDTCGARGFLPKSELASPRLIALLGPPDA